MQDLELVGRGRDRRQVVGISGFGSANLGSDHWLELQRLTGSTTWFLRYEAQHLPLPVVDAATVAELSRRWTLARAHAERAGEYLAGWCERWLSQDREVLLVGFSLGAFVAWEAARRCVDREIPGAAERLRVALICAATGGGVEHWGAVARLARVVNVYSSRDLVLRRLYPMGVQRRETPAAGLGPIAVDGVVNVDVTDLVGSRHLWASAHLGELVGIAVRMFDVSMAVSEHVEEVHVGGEMLTPLERARLYRWLCLDEVLWRALGAALRGNGKAAEACAQLDQWGRSCERLSSLIESGEAARAIDRVGGPESSRRRARLELGGRLRAWLGASGLVVSEVLDGSGS